MRAWAYRHPTVTFLAVLLTWLINVHVMWDSVDERRWGWAIAYFVTSCILWPSVRACWRRT